MMLRAVTAIGLIVGLMSSAGAADTGKDAALAAAVADKARPAEDTVRDSHRHPAETLAFWGLAPKQSVIELAPGGGYWTWILAAYAKSTGGQYSATTGDPAQMSEAGRKNFEAFKARYANEAKYGKVNWVPWSADREGTLGPANSADMVVVARMFHDWMWFPGQVDEALKDIHAVLKPGGIMAIEAHRADPRKQVMDARDGYVNTAYLVSTVEKAGFKLDGSSEVNANPKDTKDYPLGVWNLPPTNATTRLSYMMDWPGLNPSAKMETEKYKAIGESDRMTLRFRKR